MRFIQITPFLLGHVGNARHKGCQTLAVQECDLLVAVGARFDDRVTGKLNEFAPHAKVIHFDIDTAEINKRRFADAAILGDLKVNVPLLSRELDIAHWQAKSSWYET